MKQFFHLVVTQTTAGRELNTNTAAEQTGYCCPGLLLQTDATNRSQPCFARWPPVCACVHLHTSVQTIALWCPLAIPAYRCSETRIPTAGGTPPSSLVRKGLYSAQQAILDTLIKCTGVGTGHEQVTDVTNVTSSMTDCSWFLQTKARTKRNHLEAEKNSSLLLSPFLLSAPIFCILPLAIEAIM